MPTLLDPKGKPVSKYDELKQEIRTLKVVNHHIVQRHNAMMKAMGSFELWARREIARLECRDHTEDV